MTQDEMEKRIQKLENLVTALCVATQGWNNQEDLSVINWQRSTINHHARKFINTAIVKHEHSKLKSKLDVLEQDYPELKE